MHSDGEDYEIHTNFAGQLTNNSASDNYPRISGTNVVWEAEYGSDYEIYSNFAGQLTNNSTDDRRPDISGTNVVWQGWDGPNTAIYSNFAGQLSDGWAHLPAISGTNVVWMGAVYDGWTYNEAILSNFAGQISTPSYDSAHDISGTNVVWRYVHTTSQAPTWCGGTSLVAIMGRSAAISQGG